MTRQRRILLAAVLALVLIAVVAVGGGGWYLSNLIRDGGLVPDHEDPVLDLEIIALADGRITLRAGPDADEDGRWSMDGLFGLERAAGYDQVGPIVSAEDSEVVRRFIRFSDNARQGDMARVDNYAFPEDPREAFGLEFEEVMYTSSLGEFPAWLVGGTEDTWVIMVHGRNAHRREALRMLPEVAELGLPALVINYRNDEGLPADPSGYYRYGRTEWLDLEGAVKYALEHGALDLVLVGYSMGGGIVANFLYESDLSGVVRGVILDAPMLDFGATVDLGAANRGYPGVVSALAKAFAGFRFDIDWEATNYLDRVDKLRAPILLFHGDEDTTVPISTSDNLSDARPGLVEYVRVSGAEHVGAWNKDRETYEDAVGRFLARVSR
jgi:hypothetical protein